MSDDLKVAFLRCEYRFNPLGIDVHRPRISWQLLSDRRGTMQQAYRVLVARDEHFADIVWDSGIVESDRSVHVPYDGPPLSSRTRYFFKVKVWDTFGRESDWSEPAWWETALFDPREWRASWITPDARAIDPSTDAAFLLRKRFEIRADIRYARIYATAAGAYELYLNGSRVSPDVLAPGWTCYPKRLQYQTYDVTALLRRGANAVGILLGDGWYRSGMGFENRNFRYGDRRAALLQLHVTHSDGLETVIATDGTWKASTGPILYSTIYHGEIYDARLEQTGWDEPDFDDGHWKPVETVEMPKHHLIAQENVPTRVTEIIRPVASFVTPAGDRVLDMGQNMVGRIRMSVRAPAGTRIVLRHAEVLDRKGNIYFGNLRSARQTVEYIAKGEGVETYAPHFTFMGFRYVKVEGYPGGDPPLDAFAGEVTHSDMEPAGEFVCSDERINRLQQNIVWGQRGNFVDVPTDCPQRDERLGWTGDAQVFIRTALFNFLAAPFFTKWLRDLKAEQHVDGGVPFVVPDVVGGANSAGWGDAATICPWAVYLYYGDERLLAEQYDSMKKWVEYIRAQAGQRHIWDSGFHFGDWLALDAKENSYTGSTPKELIATAFYAWSTRIVRDAARMLGYEDDAKEYDELYQNIVRAFRDEFITPSGRIAAPTQTAHVLALAFDLVNDRTRARTIRDLHDLVAANDYHLTTGFLGTPYLCFALSDNGHHETAVKVWLQETFPGWLYAVLRGATTVWEHWDGIKPDGSFWSDDMNSFNHYAYGAIGDWMYRRVAGLEPDERAPGFKRIRIEPRFGGPTIAWAKAVHRSLYGPIEVAWNIGGGQISVSASVPPNTTADVVLRGARLADLTESGRTVARADGVLSARETDLGVELVIGSGAYRFAYPDPGLFRTVYTEHTRLVDFLNDPRARSALERRFPKLAAGPLVEILKNSTMKQIVENGMAGIRPEEMRSFLEELS